MKKDQKGKPQPTQKQGRPLKDFVPSNIAHIHDPIQVVPPGEPDKDYRPENIPMDLFEEWSNETDASKAILEDPSEEVFKEPNPEKIFLPDSLYHDVFFGEVKWSRPIDYIRENHLNDEILRHFPNKNNFKFRAKVHEMYEKEKEIQRKKEEGDYYEGGNSDSNDSQDSLGFKRDKFSFYRDYFKIIDTVPTILIVNFISREETDEELEIRIKKEEEEIERIKKENKTKKKGEQINVKDLVVNKEKLVINESSPSNIYTKDGYPTFSYWIASILQIIKDRNIVDANTKETIWQKIYPQKNGVPIYNPKGKYWVKLYHFGKFRKIEIDDTMPVSKYDMFCFPKCHNLEELWPALLTKALVKLYSYKIVSNTFHESGDYSALYSLTGYIPETLKIDRTLYHMFDNEVPEEEKQEENEAELSEETEKLEFFKRALVDKNYENNQCVLLCYRGKEEVEKEEAKEIVGQKIYKTEVQKSETNLKFGGRKTMRRLSSIRTNSSKSLMELKRIRGFNKGVPTIQENFVEDISSLKHVTDLKKISAKVLLGDKKDKDKGDADDQKIQTFIPKFHEMFDNKIHIGVLYNVLEFFDNQKFNMARLLPIDFSDLRAMVKQLNTTYVFKQLPREEKKIYIKKLKEIKMKQKEEKAKRIEGLKQKGSDFYSIKINNMSFDDINFFNPHTDEEIEMTKQCLLNKWDFPPIEYLDKIYEEKYQPAKAKEEQAEEAQKEEPKKEPPKEDQKDKTPRKVSKEEIKDKTATKIKDGKETKEDTKDKAQKGPKEDPKEKKPEAPVQPPEQLPQKKEDDKDKKSKNNTWAKDVYYSLIDNNLDQYKEPKEPLIREKGPWVEPDEFFKCFNSFIMLYNSSFYKNRFDWDNVWYDKTDAFRINPNNKVIHFSPKEIVPVQDDKPGKKDNKKNAPPVEQEEEKTEEKLKNYILVLFSANSDKTNRFRDVPYSIHFKLVKKGQSLNEGKEITLRSFFSSTHISDLDVNEEYYLVYNGGIFPSGFHVQFLSDFFISPLHFSDYLAENQSFSKSSIRVEHGNLQKDEPYLLARAQITVNSKTGFIIISHGQDKYLQDFTEVFICKYCEDNSFKPQKKKYTFDHFFVLPEGQYIVAVSVKPPYNVAGEAYEIDILQQPIKSEYITEEEEKPKEEENEEEKKVVEEQKKTVESFKSIKKANETPRKGDKNTKDNKEKPAEDLPKPNAVIEEIIGVAPYDISDFYTENKHFILFKEFVFSAELTFAMLSIRLWKKVKLETNDDLSSQNAPPNHNNKKEKVAETKFEEIEIFDKIRMKLEVYDNNLTLIYKTDFYNNLVLHNLIIKGTTLAETKKKDNKKDPKEEPPQNKPYKIICYIDQTELPENFTHPSYREGLGWTIRVFSSDTLGFAKDTSKEDAERALIESWEINEPGRAAKAKISRQRYLLERKKKEGEELTEEEEKILSTPRERKKFSEEAKTQGKDEKEKEKDKKKKNEKPAAKKKQTEEEKEKEKEQTDKFAINFEKEISKDAPHSSLFIKNFLHYAYDDRLITYNHGYEQEEKELNTEVLMTQKEEEINAKFEDSVKMKTELVEDEEKIKKELAENSEKFKQDILSARKKEGTNLESILKSRDAVKTTLSDKKDCEDKLIELLSQEAQSREDPKSKYDLKGAIALYLEIVAKGYDLKQLDEVNTVLSHRREEEIKAEISKVGKGKEKAFKEQAQKLLDEIHNNKWKITTDTLDKLQDFVEENNA